MTMPEAAVNKKHRLEFRENQIRFARQLFHMQAKPKSLFVQIASDHQFGFCIFPPDPAHIKTSLRFWMNIGHAVIYIILGFWI